jgi:hypothetical protein
MGSCRSMGPPVSGNVKPPSCGHPGMRRTRARRYSGSTCRASSDNFKNHARAKAERHYLDGGLKQILR